MYSFIHEKQRLPCTEEGEEEEEKGILFFQEVLSLFIHIPLVVGSQPATLSRQEAVMNRGRGRGKDEVRW